MTTLPLEYGFASEKWSKAVQIILEKKPGYPLINRLRGIIILEADYYWVLRLIWGKCLFQKAISTQSLIQAQQALPGHQYITAALNKVLVYDLLRLTQSLGERDATTGLCPPHAMICCRRMDLSKSSAQMLRIILQNTIYKLRTGHGTSAKVYMSNQIRRILGTGQGSVESPYIWALVLDIILWSVAKNIPVLN